MSTAADINTQISDSIDKINAAKSAVKEAEGWLASSKDELAATVAAHYGFAVGDRVTSNTGGPEYQICSFDAMASTIQGITIVQISANGAKIGKNGEPGKKTDGFAGMISHYIDSDIEPHISMVKVSL